MPVIAQSIRSLRRYGAAIAILAFLTALPARADELRIFAAGAVQKAVVALIPPFEQATGHKITAVYDTVGALRDRVLAGENPHIVLLSSPALKTLEERGRLAPGSTISVGRTGVGLMGQPAQFANQLPDIGTPEKLKALLLSAASIAHADPARGATAGTHFRKVITDLGIAGELAPRITVVPFGGAIADEVAAGKFEIGVSQATEIVPNPNVRFLGFLPDALQLWTVYGAAPAGAPSAAARQFLDALTSADGRAAFARIGFSPTN